MSSFGDDGNSRRTDTGRSRRVEPNDTVRRPPGPNAEYVRQLLRHLQRHEWPGAPRFLGVDEQGYDVLERYPGRPASRPYQPPAVWSDASLARVARLLRQLHDLTVGTVCAGDGEVACHNDVIPANTVYRETPDGLRPSGFVNWEFASPGRRVHDLAYACWRFLDLGPARSEPTGPARLMRLMCDSYELSRNDRGDLVDTVLWWQERILAEGTGDTEEHDLPTGAPRTPPTTTSPGDPTDRNSVTDRPSSDLPASSPHGKPSEPPSASARESLPVEELPEGEFRESAADIRAAIAWVREYGDILDAVITARNPPEDPGPDEPGADATRPPE